MAIDGPIGILTYLLMNTNETLVVESGQVNYKTLTKICQEQSSRKKKIRSLAFIG